LQGVPSGFESIERNIALEASEALNDPRQFADRHIDARADIENFRVVVFPLQENSRVPARSST
jgi:hypothetical protein